jgi:hypothetical protein
LSQNLSRYQKNQGTSSQLSTQSFIDRLQKSSAMEIDTDHQTTEYHQQDQQDQQNQHELQQQQQKQQQQQQQQQHNDNS